jgi:hypothetical protein
MLITNSPSEKDSMSPFPFKKRAFTDTTKSGNDIIIGAGATTINVLKKIYDPKRIAVVNAEFPFLTRDNKERTYDPGKEDKFVFKNNQSIQLFKKEAHRMIEVLSDVWKALDLPFEHDKDRNITIPSTDGLMKALLSDNNKKAIEYVSANYENISLILSNIDIAKKFCIVRSVFPGWWLGSYAGKEEKNYDYFRESVELHAEVFRAVKNTGQFKTIRQRMFDDMGDPLSTNVGYPIYKSGISAKTEIITMYKGAGLGSNQPYDSNSKWSTIRTNIMDQTQDRTMKSILWAVGTIRRQQYGYKWAHIMRQTEFGSVSVDDVRGFNTVRMAFLFPYVYNLLMTPYVADWNAFRYLIPGTYHDGQQKENRMKSIRNRKLFCLEADYSNYDRFQLLDMMAKLTYLGYKDHPAVESYILPMFMNTYRDIPLLLPDYNGGGKSVGIAMTADKLGLLSGGKHTSTNGTNHNSIVNIAGFLNNGLMTRNSARDYLMQYVGKADNTIGSGDEWSHMMSDDTLLLDTSLNGLIKKGKAFKEAADTAGLKSSLGIGDRFLMRHTYMGKDTPVLARIWQNTLSNETAPDHELKFLVGLATRTEGMLGQKTVDPFNLGKLTSVTTLEAYLTHEFLASILRFITTSNTVSINAVNYVKLLDAEAVAMSKGFDIKDRTTFNTRVSMSSETSNTLDRYRIAFTRELANYELKQASKSDDTLTNYLMELKGQSNIPSVKYMIEQLTTMNSEIANLMTQAGAREHSFFIKALQEVGINQFF